jgi:hypothetical protein
MTITHTVTIVVETPYEIKDISVANAINKALDEPPCDWGDWGVGIAEVTETEIND